MSMKRPTSTRVSVRDRVTIGQRWPRRRDGEIARVRQVHRADRLVEMTCETASAQPVLTVSFSELRRGWQQLDDPQHTTTT